MRKACLFTLVVVCCLHLLVPNVSFSGDLVVKSKTLSNDDVTDVVKTHLATRGEKFIRIIGIYQKDKEGDENYLIAIEDQTMEEKLIEEDLYHRQMKALKMAFSGIPRELQIVLHEIGKGRKVREISDMTGESNFEISRKRNQGLSLILQRVMRSKHLSEDEKVEIANLHDIHMEDNLEFEQTL